MEDDNKLVLRDENNEEHTFELVITLELNGKTYVLLTDEDHNGTYPFIYEVDDEKGESLYPVEDEEEFKTISEAFDSLSAQAAAEAGGCSCASGCGAETGSCCCSSEDE